MSRLRALAPAKINLGLFLGPTRESDGRHQLVTVMQSISLADELTLEPLNGEGGGEGEDVVDCPGVAGAARENLAAQALRSFRAATGWRSEPMRLRIEKRIPVAAGLGGGSADAAAALRLASRASGLGDERLLHELAAELGADVPAQVAPGRWLATGAGEQLAALADPASPFGVLVLPSTDALSTAAVYGEADRLGLGRPLALLHERRGELGASLDHGAGLPAASELLHNDLQRAAVSLCPSIADALGRAQAAGADVAMVSGSGPTVIALFAALSRAELALASLAELVPAPLLARPVGAAFGQPAAVSPAPAPGA